MKPWEVDDALWAVIERLLPTVRAALPKAALSDLEDTEPLQVHRSCRHTVKKHCGSGPNALQGNRIQPLYGQVPCRQRQLAVIGYHTNAEERQGIGGIVGWGKLRLALCAGLAAALAGVTACDDRPEGTPEPGMSPSARTYLSKALAIMEKRSLVRHRVDWAELRRVAFSQAEDAGAQKPADTYGTIRSALRSLGDNHSFFLAPEQAKEQLKAYPSGPIEGLESRSMAPGIGYLSLPGVQGAEETYVRYVRQGREAVAKTDRSRPCGWVIDLRDNTGGSMWPMLAVAGPILGDGKVGMSLDADGKKSAWVIINGSPHNESSPDYGDSPAVANPQAPVAVLTGMSTASAGEAVVVAFRGRPDTRFFGKQTNGIPTGNTDHRLSDGGLLVLTEAQSADRTGRTYDAPIAPDEEVDISQPSTGAHQDRTLEAARTWLLKQAACRQP
ncbi:S41 family peptidase [Streptomyces sp. NPDC051310]|uniref:S41 family peptidase n=1 Tax=Streptomyces sp. NPDC051310 TaxID=3365649 RepID=UPI00378FCFDE